MVNRLRELEASEYGARHHHKNKIFIEIGRIGARQFPWQRGHFSGPNLYRNAYIYGQGECAHHLNEGLGVTIFDMTLVGFSLLSVFYPDPAIRTATDMQLLHKLGIDHNMLYKVLKRISCPLTELRSKAAVLREGDESIAYKPSILRQYPCVLVGPRARTMMSPLPDLIMDRVTNGVFYDVINGVGPVRKEIGRRFEEYCISLCREMLTGVKFLPEYRYRTRLGPIDSPDIRMLNDAGETLLAIECKATRMSITARFGEVPEEDRGYEEISKGVMQLWRYFTHCRAQIGCDRLANNAQGIILTMDEWFAGRSTIIPQIIQRANDLANSSKHIIPAVDRIPVAFCTISELEQVLSTATVGSLIEAVKLGASEKVGWNFSSLHHEAKSEKTEPKEYPFEEALGELLPWWSSLGNLPDEQV